LNTKVAQVVAHELGIGFNRIRVTATDTSKIANTSATAASTGSDLNGKARKTPRASCANVCRLCRRAFRRGAGERVGSAFRA
jgi:Xanthine dehydrogenase, molybdopterin-binding subunit B